MNQNEVIPRSLRSGEIIADLAEQLNAGEITASQVEGIYHDRVAIVPVAELNHSGPHYIEARNGAQYFFEHNTWRRANGASGSNSALFFLHQNFDPFNVAHYELKGIRVRVANGFYAAELALYAEDNEEHKTVLYGQHDPSRDGVIAHFLKKVRARRS